MNTKELFTQLINQKGYASVRDFCLSNGIDYPNMNKRINGVRQKIEISFMFKIANMLHVPVEDIVRIFYIEEWNENRSNIEE